MGGFGMTISPAHFRDAEPLDEDEAEFVIIVARYLAQIIVSVCHNVNYEYKTHEDVPDRQWYRLIYGNYFDACLDFLLSLRLAQSCALPEAPSRTYESFRQHTDVTSAEYKLVLDPADPWETMGIELEKSGLTLNDFVLALDCLYHNVAWVPVDQSIEQKLRDQLLRREFVQDVAGQHGWSKKMLYLLGWSGDALKQYVSSGDHDVERLFSGARRDLNRALFDNPGATQAELHGVGS